MDEVIVHDPSCECCEAPATHVASASWSGDVTLCCRCYEHCDGLCDELEVVSLR